MLLKAGTQYAIRNTQYANPVKLFCVTYAKGCLNTQLLKTLRMAYLSSLDLSAGVERRTSVFVERCPVGRSRTKCEEKIYI
jgi:hypothetical protein